MGMMKIYGKGLATSVKSFRMIVYLWLINLAFALVIVAPLYLLVQKDFGHSLAGGRLRVGDPAWLGEMALKYQDIPPALLGGILLPALLFLLLYIFLNGGIIGRLAALPEQKITLAGFLADCGKYFWRFFRVFLAALIGYLLLFGFVFRLVSAVFKPWIDSASNELPSIIAANLRTLVIVLIFTIVQMYFDYVKVSLVAENSRKVLKVLFSSLGFVLKRFFRAWFLYLLVGVFYLVLTVLYAFVNGFFPRYGAPSFAIAVFWAQIYILLRIGIKVLFFATELTFYESQKYKAPKEQPVAAEPSIQPAL
jgi:hypothetical protein